MSKAKKGRGASTALEKTAEVGQAWTKGAIGSLAGELGKAGGETVGQIAGGAIGTAIMPGVGTAAGAKVGEKLGGAVVGGAASDAAKQAADSTMPDKFEGSIDDLYQKYEELEQKIENVQEGTGTGADSDTGQTADPLEGSK